MADVGSEDVATLKKPKPEQVALFATASGWRPGRPKKMGTPNNPGVIRPKVIHYV